jgi:hypothetical protein
MHGANEQERQHADLRRLYKRASLLSKAVSALRSELDILLVEIEGATANVGRAPQAKASATRTPHGDNTRVSGNTEGLGTDPR